MIIKKKGAKASQNRVSPPPLPVRKHGANKREPYFILISRGLRLWTQCRREGMRLVESQSRTGGMGQCGILIMICLGRFRTEYEVRINMPDIHCSPLELSMHSSCRKQCACRNEARMLRIPRQNKVDRQTGQLSGVAASRGQLQNRCRTPYIFPSIL